jgi:hypothetical protein
MAASIIQFDKRALYSPEFVRRKKLDVPRVRSVAKEVIPIRPRVSNSRASYADRSYIVSAT